MDAPNSLHYFFNIYFCQAELHCAHLCLCERFCLPTEEKYSVESKKKKSNMHPASPSPATHTQVPPCRSRSKPALLQGPPKRDVGLSAGERAAEGVSRGLFPRPAVSQEEGNLKELLMDCAEAGWEKQNASGPCHSSHPENNP